MTSPANQNEAGALVELARWCEGLTGPCRETDAEIAVAMGWFEKSSNEQWPGAGFDYIDVRDPKCRIIPGNGGGFMLVPYWTASLDAALTLVPEGYSFHMNAGPHMGMVHCYLIPDDINNAGVTDPRIVEGYAPLGCYANALTAASLRARASLLTGRQSTCLRQAFAESPAPPFPRPMARREG